MLPPLFFKRKENTHPFVNTRIAEIFLSTENFNFNCGFLKKFGARGKKRGATRKNYIIFSIFNLVIDII